MSKYKTGLIVEPVAPEDFVFGAKEKSLGGRFKNRKVLREDGDWSDSLPITEAQSTPTVETNA